MVKLLRVFINIAKEAPFHCIQFILGNILVGLAQIVSIGSLFPVLYAVMGQRDETNIFIRYADRVVSLFGLKPVLGGYLVLFLGIALASAAVSLLVERSQANFLRSIERSARMSLIKTVVDARWQNLRNLDHGEFVNTTVREVNSYKFVIKYTFIIISMSIQIIFLSYFLFRINMRFAAISFMMLALGSLAFMPLTGRANRLGHALAGAFGRLTGSLIDASRAFKNIKAGSLEGFFLRYIRPISDSTSDVYYKQQVLASLQVRSLELVGYCVLAALVYTGIGFMRVQPAELAIALVVLMRIVPQVREMNRSFHESYGYLASMAKIQKIKQLCAPRKDGSVRNEEIAGPISTIKLERVGFRYDGAAALFDSLTADMKKGEFWAICGPTGSGKTTILDLISGILEPTSGRITYDGVDSSRVRLESLHKRVGYLSQNSFIFAGSIMDNIFWGNENPDTSSLGRIIGISQLSDVVKEKGLDFRIAESGQNLSEGQKQRIAIARTLLKKYDFVMMDEPTSALDSKTEEAFIEALLSLKGSVGVVMVTHRKEYLKYADRVIQVNGDKAGTA